MPWSPSSNDALGDRIRNVNTTSHSEASVLSVSPSSTLPLASNMVGAYSQDAYNYQRDRGDLDLIALDLILDFTLPPPGFLDPALVGGPNSPWCRSLRMTKSIIMVCKHWRSAALPRLYGAVVLRRVGQVFAFAETLRSLDTDCCSLVRSLQIMCCVPEACRSRYTECVADILKRCSRVTSLTVGPTFTWTRLSVESQSAYDYDLCAAIMDCGSQLVKLEIYDDVRHERPITTVYRNNFFQSFPHLVSLSITHFPNNCMFGERLLSSDSVVTLDRLEEVTIAIYTTGAALSTWEQWRLPRLKRVCLQGNLHHSEVLSGLLAFFEAHGQVVKELVFLPLPVNYTTTELHKILDLCPSLTYVMCEHQTLEDLKKDRRVPSDSLHVDLWMPLDPEEHPYVRMLSYVEDLPRIRLLDNSFSHLPNLTHVFPPSHTPKSWPNTRAELRMTILDFFGMVVVDMGFCVLRVGSYEQALRLRRCSDLSSLLRITSYLLLGDMERAWAVSEPEEQEELFEFDGRDGPESSDESEEFEREPSDSSGVSSGSSDFDFYEEVDTDTGELASDKSDESDSELGEELTAEELMAEIAEEGLR